MYCLFPENSTCDQMNSEFMDKTCETSLNIGNDTALSWLEKINRYEVVFNF